MDRISSLPNEIICHIGSFLSAKEDVFVMLLSKRWRNLFTIIPKVEFDGHESDFEGFVDGVLALPVNTRIKTFSLKWKHSQYDNINRCLSNVVKRGVLVLELHIEVGKQGGYSLPLEVFTCRTVTTMKLGFDFVINLLPADAYLPSLKTLILNKVRFYDFDGRCAFQTLLSVSPVINELIIDRVEFERWKWCGIVSSPTLERLTIRRRQWGSPYETVGLDCRGLDYDFDRLSLDTPGLTYLEYTDYVPKEYPIVNLNSLVEAKLDLRVESDGMWDDTTVGYFDPTNLINGLKNVEILDLTIYTTYMLFIFQAAIPVFEKLISLSLSHIHCFILPILIKKSPNLKTLIIEDALHFTWKEEDGYLCPCVSEYSFLLPCPMEVLKIKKCRGCIGELEQMKHFLQKLSCLELVEVHARVHYNNDKQRQVMADLLMLPRASSKCKVQVKFTA